MDPTTFFYSNACWMIQSQGIINKIQYVQNRALRTCLRKPRCYRVQKLHKEANMQTIKELQIKLANGYISRAIKHNIQSAVDLIHKKRKCPINTCKSTLDHLQYLKKVESTGVRSREVSTCECFPTFYISDTCIP